LFFFFWWNIWLLEQRAKGTKIRFIFLKIFPDSHTTKGFCFWYFIFLLFNVVKTFLIERLGYFQVSGMRTKQSFMYFPSSQTWWNNTLLRTI